MRMLKPTITARDLRSVKPALKTGEPFYSSADWIKLRDAERAAAKGICRRPDCGKRGYIVDHIIEIRDGGAKLDPRNVELLCSSHHGLKTAEARAKRARSAVDGEREGVALLK